MPPLELCAVRDCPSAAAGKSAGLRHPHKLTPYALCLTIKSLTRNFIHEYGSSSVECSCLAPTSRDSLSLAAVSSLFLVLGGRGSAGADLTSFPQSHTCEFSALCLVFYSNSSSMRDFALPLLPFFSSFEVSFRLLLCLDRRQKLMPECRTWCSVVASQYDGFYASFLPRYLPLSFSFISLPPYPSFSLLPCLLFLSLRLLLFSCTWWMVVFSLLYLLTIF